MKKIKYKGRGSFFFFSFFASHRFFFLLCSVHARESDKGTSGTCIWTIIIIKVNGVLFLSLFFLSV